MISKFNFAKVVDRYWFFTLQPNLYLQIKQAGLCHVCEDVVQKHQRVLPSREMLRSIEM